MLIAQRREDIALKQFRLILQSLLQAALNTFRCNLERWINTATAVSSLPIVDPSVGIKLTHLDNLSYLNDLTTLRSRHHPRWKTSRSQSKHHGTSIMRTKAT